MYRLYSHLTITTISLLVLGCGGGGGALSDLSYDTTTPSYKAPPLQQSLGVLESYYVQSFEPYESGASSLRNSDARYTFQSTRWYSDLNGNGVRDEGSEELHRTYPLASSRVEYAHVVGLSGSGSVIGVIDDGFNTSHDVFTNGQYEAVTPFSSTNHGTAVSSVLAGDTRNMVGIAPKAKLLLGSYDTPQTRTAAVNAAIGANAVAINNSWGFSVSASSDTYSAFANSQNASYLYALRTYAQNGVLVFAASNDTERTTSTLMNALPLYDHQLEPGWISVVSAVPRYDEDQILSVDRRSAPCAQSAPWCITADGSWRAATGSGQDSYAFTTGTSFAAPMVSGAMAVLAEAFPNLSNHDLRDRLFATADNSFKEFSADGQVELIKGYFHTYSHEFGHGFLDLRAALLPIGPTTLTTATGATIDTSTPAISTPSTAGDALSRALSKANFIVKDHFNGAFLMPAEALTAQAPETPIHQRLDQIGLGTMTEVFGGYAGAHDHMTLNIANTQFHMLPHDEDRIGITRAYAIEQRIQKGKTQFHLGLANIQDTGALLPGSAQKTTQSITAMSMGFDHALSQNISIDGSISMGFSDSYELGGIAQVSNTSLNSLSAGISWKGQNPKSTWRLQANLPMAISNGNITFNLPTGLNDNGLQYQDLRFGLRPKNREIDLAIAFKHKFNQNTALEFKAITAFNHNHQKNKRAHAAQIKIQFNF